MPLVLAYHGCDRATARQILGGVPFRESAKSYDWLGRGSYFWEDDPLRAYAWAQKRRSHAPSIVGVAIELGTCLDMTRQSGCIAVKRIYQEYKKEQELHGRVLPVNRDAPSGIVGDLALRYLDRAVIDYLNQITERIGEKPFETIRALFPEGEPLYPNAGFRELTHVQICVRNPANILGVFRVPEQQRLRLKLPVLYEDQGTGA